MTNDEIAEILGLCDYRIMTYLSMSQSGKTVDAWECVWTFKLLMGIK